ncbi:Uncharacterised protein g5741 [Pycnogonum litorale]
MIFHRLILTSCILTVDVFALKIFEIKIPPEVFAGKDVRMQCLYQMGKPLLYSLRWFKDDVEFYSYMPKEHPKVKTFPVLGVNLDDELSFREKMILRNVSYMTSGNYSCEVSEEFPSFKTVKLTTNLNVNVIPDRPPEIFTKSDSYDIGEDVMVNCSSQPSFPPSNIRWLINEQQIDFKNIDTDILKETMGIRTMDSASFELTEELYDSSVDHELTISCNCIIPEYYNMSTSKIIRINSIGLPMNDGHSAFTSTGINGRRGSLFSCLLIVLSIFTATKMTDLIIVCFSFNYGGTT